MFTVSHEDLEQQKKLMMLFFHTHEPMHLPEHIEIATSWDLKKHIDMYNVRIRNVCSVDILIFLNGPSLGLPFVLN